MRNTIPSADPSRDILRHFRPHNRRHASKTSKTQILTSRSAVAPCSSPSQCNPTEKQCPAVSRRPVRKSPTAAHRVFLIPELLGNILIHLPVGSLRSAMFVCRQFHDCIRPNADQPLEGMRKALGLEFKRRIESIADSEIIALTKPPAQREPLLPHLGWLMNATIDSQIPLHQVSEPTLCIYPFDLDVIKQRAGTRTVKLKIKLNPKHVDYWGHPKGILRYKNRAKNDEKRVYEDTILEGKHPSWTDIKLLTMPFALKVSVMVDFREVMGASPYHHTSRLCSATGCLIGIHGVQVGLVHLTLRLLRKELKLALRRSLTRCYTPEQATLGELVALLRRIESEVSSVTSRITQERELRGKSYYEGKQWWRCAVFPRLKRAS